MIKAWKITADHSLSCPFTQACPPPNPPLIINDFQELQFQVRGNCATNTSERDASARKAKPPVFSSASRVVRVPAGSRRVENPFGALSLEHFLMVYTVQDCYCGKDYHPTLGCCWVSAGPAITTTGPVCMNIMVQVWHVCLFLDVGLSYQFIFSKHFNLVRIVVNLELIPGTQGAIREYTLNVTPVHHSASHTPRTVLQTQSTCWQCFWEAGQNWRTVEPGKPPWLQRNSTETITWAQAWARCYPKQTWYYTMILIFYQDNYLA